MTNRDELRARREARLKTATVRPSSEVRRRGIDLDGLRCVDLGHRWLQTELGRQRDGALKGLPARICICEGCGCERIDVLTWAGSVVSRWYSHDPAWLEGFRDLDPDDRYARRGEYRRLLVGQLKARRNGHAEAG